MVKSGNPRLDTWTEQFLANYPDSLGYPTNNESALRDFYRWYTDNHLERMLINNAGDPFKEERQDVSTLNFEREVIEYFAPKYGFDLDDVWGLVSMSGTDGNNHGIYFGVNYLKKLTGKDPIVYVSDEAHYSNYRLCNLQNLDVRLVKTNEMGCITPDELEKTLCPERPCLMVYAMGSTFKGAIDDQAALNAVLNRHTDMAVYRHVDAALFGGYLPFTPYHDFVNRKTIPFDSISISGHKFFGIDSPCGLFITTRQVYDNQSTYSIPYLNGNMRMINCSRSGLEALKFWWLIQHVGDKEWTTQAARIFKNTTYLLHALQKIGWPCWANRYSNTVVIRRPSTGLVKKYNLACGESEALGGKLAHVVVMQHVDELLIDQFVAALKEEMI